MSRAGDLIEAIHDRLDPVVDHVLRYKPAPKSKAAKRRRKKAAKKPKAQR